MTTTAATEIVATLAAHGVDRVHCVAGESYLPVLDALFDNPRVEVVTCRHEGSAAFMALADAKLTGRAGVCVVNRGPGATNAAIGLHSAAQDASPLLLVVGQVLTGDLGRRAFQEVDYATTFGDLAKGVWVLHDPERAAELTARALRVAEAGAPGATVLVVPEDVLSRPARTGTGPAAAPLPPAQLPPAQLPATPARQQPAAARYPATEPSEDGLRRVRELLAAAHRPVLLAGGRLATPAGRVSLRRAAERLALPVLASNKHQDLFDNRHPLYAGHLHIATQAGQRDLLAGADLVLAVGTRLDHVTTQGYRLPAAPVPAQPLVHVYPDPTELGAVYQPTLGFDCDPAAFLSRLASQDEPADRLAERRSWADRLHAAEDEQARWHPVAASDGVVFGSVVSALGTLTQGELVLSVDAGNFTSWVHRYLRFTGAGELLGIGSSAMGFGVPAGVAAAMRRGDRLPVVTIAGDGGFLMTGSELATAVEHEVRLLVVVANNGSYGTIRQHQERHYPGRVVGTDLTNPDFAALARAYGAFGVSVQEDQEVLPALRRALQHPGPAVVDVHTSLAHISAYQHLPRLGAGRVLVPAAPRPSNGRPR